MRQHYDRQARFDSTPIGELMLNYDCRDETIPVLAGLQHVYTCGSLRNRVVKLVAEFQHQFGSLFFCSCYHTASIDQNLSTHRFV